MTDLEKITELRHQLHREPELSMQEKKTMETLKAFLRDNTSLEITDCGNWFYCRREGTGEPIAFRADMDALPIEEDLEIPHCSQNRGISHKCGHDGHSAALCGLALALENSAAEREVYLIFQPGEEIGAGGSACAELLKEKGIREVYAAHSRSGFSEGAVVLKEGLTQPASEGLRICFEGKTAHASEPENGISPMPALGDLIRTAGELSAKPEEEELALCTIVYVHAGAPDYGIAAGQGELAVTLRAEREERMLAMERKLRDEAEKAAERDGLKVSFEVSDYFPETRNHAQCLDKIRQAARELGVPVLESEEIWRASEDFGYYTKNCQGAIFYVGNGEDYPPLHTLEFDFNDKNLSTIAQIFLKLALS